MENPAFDVHSRYSRFLPYLAVLSTDLRQTFRNWVYRLWIVATILVAIGFLLYRFGLHQEAGMIRPASVHSSELFRGIALGSLALIVVLTVSAVASERGTLADSVLSRGISRYQYFLAKLHSRAIVIVLTFAVMSSFMLVAFHFFLGEDLSLAGVTWAVLTISCLLIAVVSVGVAMGAITNSSVVGIAILWIAMYGLGILMSLLPQTFPSPEKVIARLPFVLRGEYELNSLGEWVLGSLFVAFVASTIGLIAFARRDV